MPNPRQMSYTHPKWGVYATNDGDTNVMSFLVKFKGNTLICRVFQTRYLTFKRCLKNFNI